MNNKYKVSVLFHENTSKYNKGKAYMVEETSTMQAAFNQLMDFACDRDKYFFASDNLDYYSPEQIRAFKEECRGLEFLEQIPIDSFNVDYVATEKAGIYRVQPDMAILVCEDLANFIDCGDYSVKIEEI